MDAGERLADIFEFSQKDEYSSYQLDEEIYNQLGSLADWMGDEIRQDLYERVYNFIRNSLGHEISCYKCGGRIKDYGAVCKECREFQELYE